LVLHGILVAGRLGSGSRPSRQRASRCRSHHNRWVVPSAITAARPGAKVG
jgi:hypothetical protein